MNTHCCMACFLSATLQKTGVLVKPPTIPHGLFSFDQNYEGKKLCTMQNTPKALFFSFFSLPFPTTNRKG